MEVGRETARSLARRELSQPEYQRDRPGLLERLVTWLRDRVADLLDIAADASPGGWPGLALLLAALLVGVIAVRLRVGALARSRRTREALFVGPVRSAADYRAAADGHASRQEWAEAVRQRLRAVLRGLEERGLLDPHPGRTADEAARDAGLALPGCADDLLAAARTFDEIWYGARPATPEHDRALRELDRRVAAARPVREGTGGDPG